MVPTNSLYNYVKARLFGVFDARNDAFTSQRLPTVDAFGGGMGVQRQLLPFAETMLAQPMVTPVGITGNGADLTGMLTTLPLIDLNNQT